MSKVGARECGEQIVICSSKSVNKTIVGNSVVPVPYPVQCTLSHSNRISRDVYFNGHKAFIMQSDTSYVSGDRAGSRGGVKSGTVSKEAEPIEHSHSVNINCRKAVRCGDKFYMNAKNTTGYLTCSSAMEAPHINDKGKLECKRGSDE